jgi:hypothetical protein
VQLLPPAAGNFTRNSRTLYVGGLKSPKDNPKATEAALWKQFGEWGEVENINVIHRLSICFVRFRHRMSAEFAKEAMTNQALEHGEVLNIRWAFDDPNPVAKEAATRADHDAIVAMVKTKGASTEAAAFHYPDEYQMPESKKQRIEGDTFASYPDTDTQFAPGDGAGAPATSETDAYAQLSYADPTADPSTFEGERKSEEEQ